MTDRREYDKLVRDGVPAIIHENGEVPVVHTAAADEYAERLAEKLVEETPEFDESGELEELADVLEVIRAICAYRDVGVDELDAIGAEKADDRGGFRERVVLDAVEPSGE